ncbi:hypothetical protein PHMEG_00028129, partial [Phytophthora megakarya]
MRRIFSGFSEPLLVECFHTTNLIFQDCPVLTSLFPRYNYQLLTSMTMNEYSEGAVVQHSLLEANGDSHMDKAIMHFKRMHPTKIKLFREILVDKDMNEITVLENHFPEAKVLICHFHIIKYLKDMRGKVEFGKISTDDASQIDACIHNTIYADSDATYEAAHSSLKD